MSRCRFPWLFQILLLALTPSFGASPGVRVEESKTQLQISASESRLKLAVSGAPTGGRSVRVDVELLDPKDRIVKALSQDSILTAGFNLLEIPLGGFFSELSQKGQADFLWYRLRYRLKSSKPASDSETVEGVLSISEISSQPFQLKVGLPRYGVEGTRCRVHVFTSQPASGRSVKGVTVTGMLTIEDETGERILAVGSVRAEEILLEETTIELRPKGRILSGVPIFH